MDGIPYIFGAHILSSALDECGLASLPRAGQRVVPYRVSQKKDPVSSVKPVLLSVKLLVLKCKTYTSFRNRDQTIHFPMALHWTKNIERLLIGVLALATFTVVFDVSKRLNRGRTEGMLRSGESPHADEHELDSELSYLKFNWKEGNGARDRS